MLPRSEQAAALDRFILPPFQSGILPTGFLSPSPIRMPDRSGAKYGRN